ncbi:MAG TPA: ABC transporter ATP-binding protein [Stellaceae bacterium]|nr:ABC transporter ATP-binding protein [Stellaceae bacterium]
MTPLVSVEGLTVGFTAREGIVQAVNGVDFTLERGAVMAILGESGSGKSVTLRALMRLLPPARTRIGGRVTIAGHDVLTLDQAALSAIRGPVVSMIFQEPMLAFDPVFTIGQQIGEAVIRHEGIGAKAARQRAFDLFDRVQIPLPARRLDAYPHELSGGMRQRAMIALALACRPALLLADEPTTALDATVQIQILLLLRDLQRELGMAVIFVTHDMGVATEIADSIAVMYAGRIVEQGAVRDVLRRPLHPYTRGLLNSTVQGSSRGQRLETIPGSPPGLIALPSGCSFAPRCRHAMAACLTAAPRAVEATPGHVARCVLVEPAGAAMISIGGSAEGVAGS